MSQSDTAPENFGIAVFPGFQALDAFGPLDILNTLSFTKKISLAILANTLDPVPTIPRSLAGVSLGISQSIVPTHTFANPPGNLEVLLVPGGFGTHEPEDSAAAVAFVKDIYPKLKYIISVCTGSIILARAGVLEGKKATTNKAMWEQATATSNGANIKWVPAARWVVDGNVYTTSGVAAGMDGTFAFIAKIWGEEVATSIANIIEYERHTDPHWDPFAAIHGVSGA